MTIRIRSGRCRRQRPLWGQLLNYTTLLFSDLSNLWTKTKANKSVTICYPVTWQKDRQSKERLSCRTLQSDRLLIVDPSLNLLYILPYRLGNIAVFSYQNTRLHLLFFLFYLLIAVTYLIEHCKLAEPSIQVLVFIIIRFKSNSNLFLVWEISFSLSLKKKPRNFADVINCLFNQAARARTLNRAWSCYDIDIEKKSLDMKIVMPTTCLKF